MVDGKDPRAGWGSEQCPWVTRDGCWPGWRLSGEDGRVLSEKGRRHHLSP